MPRKNPAFIRYLGWNERYQAALHLLDMYRCNILTCRYAASDSVSLRGDEAKQFFERVVAQTVLQHPVLQVGLACESSNHPYFTHISTVDLGKHVTWIDITSLEDYNSLYSKVSREQRDTKFFNLETEPGWRMVIFKHESQRFLEVLFAWNHANADGMSGRIFHESLLRNLNASGDMDELPALEARSFKTNTMRNNLLPQQENLARFTKQLGWLATMVWKELRVLQFGPAITDATWAPMQTANVETEFRTLDIPNDILVQILAACRKHNTTLTGLLHALVLASLSHRLPENDAMAFLSASAISTRPLLKPSSEYHDPPYDPNATMGNLVTFIEHEFSANVVACIRKHQGTESIPVERLIDIIWPAAAAVRGDLKECVDSGMRNQPVSIMSLVSDWRKFHIQKAKKPRREGWAVSNLGVLDGEPATPEGSLEPRWKIDRARFQLSAEVPQAFFHLCPVTVKGKALTIDISWQRGIVDTSLGEYLTTDIDTMRRYIGTAG